MRTLPRGFTLIETLIAIVVGSLVLAWASKSVVATSQVTQHLREASQLASRAENVLFWLRRDLSETVLIASSSDADDLVLFLPGGTKRRYRVQSERLLRGVDTVTEGVVTLSFRYLDPAGNPTVPSSSSMIETTLTLEVGGSRRNLTDTAALRQVSSDLEGFRYVGG